MPDDVHFFISSCQTTTGTYGDPADMFIKRTIIGKMSY